MIKYKVKPVLFFILLTGFWHLASAQSNNGFVNSFYLGLKGGANLSHVLVLDQYQIFSSIGQVEAGSKEYDKIYQNLGYQYGIVGLYTINDKMNLIFEPTFAHYRFGYSGSNTWIDTDNEGMARTSSQEHKQHLRYLELPLLLQIYRDMAPLKPYVIAGGYYGLLMGAEKLMHISEVTTINDQDFTTSSEDQRLFYNDQYIKSRLAAVAEIGAIYDFNNLQIMFGIGYHFSFNNITNENARYSNQMITGSSYDINDNIRLNSLNLNVRIFLPLNKPSNLIKSLTCQL